MTFLDKNVFLTHKLLPSTTRYLQFFLYTLTSQQDTVHKQSLQLIPQTFQSRTGPQHFLIHACILTQQRFLKEPRIKSFLPCIIFISGDTFHLLDFFSPRGLGWKIFLLFEFCEGWIYKTFIKVVQVLRNIVVSNPSQNYIFCSNDL